MQTFLARNKHILKLKQSYFILLFFILWTKNWTELKCQAYVKKNLQMIGYAFKQKDDLIVLILCTIKKKKKIINHSKHREPALYVLLYGMERWLMMEGGAKRTVRQKISYSVKLSFILSVCIYRGKKTLAVCEEKDGSIRGSGGY